jgi:ectoine hydroxylase-related dioxygenase (phytanoyl-CoA dioxygenase family)
MVGADQMNKKPSRICGAINGDGYCLIESAIEQAEIDAVREQFISLANSAASKESQLQNSRGANYGARNVLDWFPPSLDIWRTEKILDVLADTLGMGCGLVRGLFFDKPPSRSWALPWHKDMTIAVLQHLDIQPDSLFKKPTTKAGVAHVEAPENLLTEMLTLRIHLDPVTADNGPLKVIRGSHKEGKKTNGANLDGSIDTILANAGDVLAIRPLVSHSSPESAADCTDHRRILHLEFAPQAKLADSWQWNWFHPVF